MRNYVKPFPCYSTYNAVYKVFNQIQVVRLKICDSHLTCKVPNKCLNVRERVEVLERNTNIPSLPELSCELSMSVKENPDRNFFFVFIDVIKKPD